MDLMEKVFVINPDFVFREEDEGAFLFNPETDALHCINRVGAYICKLCDGINDLDRISKSISDEFDVDITGDIFKKDIEAFVTKMTQLKLIEEKH